MSKKGEKDLGLLLLAGELIALGASTVALTHGRLANAGVALSIAVAIPCWVVVIKAPTYCGVTTLKGHPCPNRTTGVLFGCTQAEGHVWAKFFARFGWHRQMLPAAASGPAKATSPYASGSIGSPAPISITATPVLVRIAEDRKNNIAFWFGACSTVTGIISTITSILALR